MSNDICRCGQPATHDASWQRGDYQTTIIRGQKVVREGWIEHRKLCEGCAKREVAGPTPPRWLKRLTPAKRTKQAKGTQLLIPGTENVA